MIRREGEMEKDKGPEMLNTAWKTQLERRNEFWLIKEQKNNGSQQQFLTYI